MSGCRISARLVASLGYRSLLLDCLPPGDLFEAEQKRRERNQHEGRFAGTARICDPPHHRSARLDGGVFRRVAGAGADRAGDFRRWRNRHRAGFARNRALVLRVVLAGLCGRRFGESPRAALCRVGAPQPRVRTGFCGRAVGPYRPRIVATGRGGGSADADVVLLGRCGLHAFARAVLAAAVA